MTTTETKKPFKYKELTDHAKLAEYHKRLPVFGVQLSKGVEMTVEAEDAADASTKHAEGRYIPPAQRRAEAIAAQKKKKDTESVWEELRDYHKQMGGFLVEHKLPQLRRGYITGEGDKAQHTFKYSESSYNQLWVSNDQKPAYTIHRVVLKSPSLRGQLRPCSKNLDWHAVDTEPPQLCSNPHHWTLPMVKELKE